MRHVFLMGLLLLLWIGPARGAGGTLGVYTDPEGTSCNIVEQSGLLALYVVHHVSGGAVASRFSAPQPACMTGVSYLSDTTLNPPPIGNTQTGISVGYSFCATGPVATVQMNYSVMGTSELCCLYPVLPDPSAASGEIEVVDCDSNAIFGLGEVAVVNGDASCPCGFTVPVEETTWGHIKAQFVNEVPSD